MSVIRTDQLAKSFRHTTVVQKLSLEVPESSIFALVGPNGAGKTTVIKMLMNILRPSAGSAVVLGVDSRRLGSAEFSQIGYVSENQELPLWMTVDYFMSFLKPFYPAWDDAWAQELLQQLDLPGDRRLRDLSRGMQVKAALASSLAYHPRLIVLDEPFSGLDSLVRDELIEALLERCEGATVVISSHDLAEIETFASHICYLDGGRLCFSEEMTTLAARFREVEITFDQPPDLPPTWPEAWLVPTIGAAILRFVDSGFHGDFTPAEIRRVFPSARAVSINPMPLRAIFVSLLKSTRTTA